jgi:hypothetical protein
MKLTKTPLMLLLLATVASTSAAGLQILSFSANGRLIWTNTYPNGLYDVEWAPKISGPWSASWTALQSMVATGATAAADVPMFYRVKCTTNLLMPLPIGAWTTMAVSNAAGNVWTQKVSVVGTVYIPSKSSDFRILEMLNPIDPPNAPILAMRSTESAVYGIDQNCGAEALWFTNAPLGVGWATPAVATSPLRPTKQSRVLRSRQVLLPASKSASSASTLPTPTRFGSNGGCRVSVRSNGSTTTLTQANTPLSCIN